MAVKRKVVSKKASTKEKTTTKKTTAKKVVAKKTTAKKTAAMKKPVAKKKVATKKKVTAKKTVVKKKPTAKKKVVAKKTIAKKKVTVKKTVVKKKPTVKKKVVAKKTTAKKKVTVKKTVIKKKPAAKKQIAAKKTTAKKKVTVKKTVANKKTVTKKPAAKKATVKKTAVKKPVVNKKTSKASIVKEVSQSNKAGTTTKMNKPSNKVVTPVVNQSKPTMSKKTIAEKIEEKRAAPMVIEEGHIRSDIIGPVPSILPYQPKPGEQYMSDDQLAHFCKVLNAWRQALMEDVDKTVGNLQGGAENYADPNDRATQEEEFSLELRTRDRERKLLKKIAKTIKNIDEDDFGYCEACGVEIGLPRLEVRPTATLCIDCKTVEELREKQLTL